MVTVSKGSRRDDEFWGIEVDGSIVFPPKHFNLIPEQFDWRLG